jgi:hypothetical protein
MKIDLSKVYEGWKNNLLPSKELRPIINNVSRERMAVCEDCEFHSKHHKTFRLDDHCTNCGCTLSAKTKCLSCECPISKWLPVLEEDKEQELKTAMQNE